MATMKWKPLPTFKDVPALLVLPDFGLNSYTLHVTDLANVWVESLDRKGIVKRSLNEDTSIDPTEGSEQMSILLTKIQAAFDTSLEDYSQTSLTLAASSEHEEDGLRLTVTCILPGDLKPLKWPFQLKKGSSALVTSQLVLPLIQAQHTRAREIEMLISSLKEKDAIIDKLLTKLENEGIGLDNIFNTLTGKRKPSREFAEEKVRGLGPFKENEWRSKNLDSEEVPDDVASLVQGVFSEPVHCVDMGLTASDDISSWWASIGSKPISGVQPEGKPGHAEASKDAKTHQPKPAIDEDDDFQVQATPPHLASRRKDNAQIGDDTTDEDVEAIPDSHPAPAQHGKSRLGALGQTKATQPVSSQSSRQTATVDDETESESETESVKYPPPRKPAARLGQVGIRPKHTEPRRGSSPQASPSVQATKTGDETASESDKDAPPKIASPAPTNDPSPPPKRKLGGLGRVGNKMRQTSVSPEDEAASPEASGREPSTSAKPTSRRLGAVGKRETVRGESPSGTLAETESEEQKAERKRAELAKELEKKAAAPAKKKRKF
ncbi:hypothetical protein JX266_011608 [Neoarthrinium moseri]|nr:hypothetical protein JX266_011608 [Neoarthrinium moseri]